MPPRVDVRATGTSLRPWAPRKTSAPSSKESRTSQSLSARPLREAVCEEEVLQSDVMPLSCIHEEEDEETSSPSHASRRGPGCRGTSSFSAKEALTEVVEPLDENLNRLQRKVASMLEMQRRSSSQEDLKSHSSRAEPELKRHERRVHDEPVAADYPQYTVEEPVESRPWLASCPSQLNTRAAGSGTQCTQYRELLAEHYKQQLQMLDEEEAELQHQMQLRQQLRVELHEEQERCEEAARTAELAEAQPGAHVEDRQLELLRSLEEQLRISEERRLELERENRVLQSRIQKTPGPSTKKPSMPSAMPRSREREPPKEGLGRAELSRRDKSPPASHSQPQSSSFEARPSPTTATPLTAFRAASPRTQDRSHRQAKPCSPPPPSPATDCRDFGKKVTTTRGVAKFQHPRPARVVLPVRPSSRPRSAPQVEKMQGARPAKGPALTVKLTPRVEASGFDGRLKEAAAPLSSRVRLPSPTAKMSETTMAPDSPRTSSPEGRTLSEGSPAAVPTSIYADVRVQQEALPSQGAFSHLARADLPTWAMPQVIPASTKMQLGSCHDSSTGASAETLYSPPKPRLCSGKGLVWPSLDLSWGEGPASAEVRRAVPPSLASCEGSTPTDYAPGTSQAMWASHLAHERSGTSRAGSPPQDRGLLRSSSMACTSARAASPQKQSLVPADFTEPLAVSPSPSSARISSLVRSSSTPLVGQSRFSASAKALHPGLKLAA
ncbi:PIP5K4 [Symbiodinium sp. CCMP2592]|nr:PIP5K4 [Symbiodinium sp. CCMP2592]